MSTKLSGTGEIVQTYGNVYVEDLRVGPLY